MNLKKATNEQKIIPEKIIGSNRYDVIERLSGENNIGIELGVAKGDFSKKMIQSKKLSSNKSNASSNVILNKL